MPEDVLKKKPAAAGGDEARGGRVLLVSYCYPPVGMVGSIRTVKLAKFLGRHGWSATVLTVTDDSTTCKVWDRTEGEFPGVAVVRARFFDLLTALNRLLMALGILDRPEVSEVPGAAGSVPESRGRPLRAVFAWLKRWAAFPDRGLPWFPSALLRGLRELRRGGYDLIFSTSPPATDHLVAAALQRLTGLPWVADLRDPWVRDQIDATRTWRYLGRKLERLTLRRASAIVTVSEPLADELREFHGDREGGIICITNGFDPDDFPGGARPSDDCFVITHTGLLAGLHRDPEVLVSVLEELVEEGKAAPGELRLSLYGPPDPGLVKRRQGMAHPELLEIAGVVPRSEALALQKASTVLLVVMADHPHWARMHGGKVLEYLGAERPILVWSPAGGIIDELIEKTGAGAAVGNRESLKRTLEAWLAEFRETGGLAFKGDREEINRYRWDCLAARFAGLFELVAGETGGARGRPHD